MLMWIFMWQQQALQETFNYDQRADGVNLQLLGKRLYGLANYGPPDNTCAKFSYSLQFFTFELNPHYAHTSNNFHFSLQ